MLDAIDRKSECLMKITIEGERPEDRKTPFHKRIVEVVRLPNSRSGCECTLECGHKVRTFGTVQRLDGVALCQDCRAAAGG